MNPFPDEPPCLRPLLDGAVELCAMVAKACVCLGLLSRDNCILIEEAGAPPRIFAKGNPQDQGIAGLEDDDVGVHL
ncbi:MAG: hypothetical protein M1388_03335 [Thaumarchaeota archaeon]|nr:hypothetical protein [Nitrososphaerota archaeon]